MATKIVPAAICANCENPVTLEQHNHFGSGWLCAVCDNIVAFEFEGAPVDPKTVARPDWSERPLSRCQKIDNHLSIAYCSTKKDSVVLELLARMAKEEEMSFRLHQSEMQAAFLLDAESYLGYAMWTVDDQWAVLRQLYIIPEKQRVGLGSVLLNFWVQDIASKVSDTFGVESPNEKGLGLLVKNGYAKLVKTDGEDDQIEGVKCKFVQSL